MASSADRMLMPSNSLLSVTEHCNSSAIWCLFDVAQLSANTVSSVNNGGSGNVHGQPLSSSTGPLLNGFPPSSMFDLLMSLDDSNDTDVDFEARMRQMFAARQSFNSQATVDGFKTAVDGLNLFATPVIIAVGVIGNALSLAVFSLTHLRRLSSSCYLSTLSIADIVFLMALIVVWLQRVEVDLFARDGWCQSVQYAIRVSEFLAAWYVVSFTAERYVTVYCPLRKDSYCTKRRAWRIVSALALLAFVFYLPTFWTYDVVLIGPRAACSPLPRHHYVVTAMTTVELLVSCLIPSFVIVALNIRIIAKIHRYQQVTLDAAGVPTNFVATTAAAAAAAAAAAKARPAAQAAAPAPASDGAAVPGMAPTCTKAMRRRSMVQTSVSASGSMHIKFVSYKSATPSMTGNNSHHAPPLVPVVQSRQIDKRQSSSGPRTQNHEPVLMGSPPPPPRCRTSVTARDCGQSPVAVAVPVRRPLGADVKRRLVRGQSQLRTARMLLVLSSVIVLLNLPAHLFRVEAVIRELIGGQERAHRDRFTWKELFQLVQFTNFAVNFFVYSLCGRQFRTGLVQLCSRQRLCIRRCVGQVKAKSCHRCRSQLTDRSSKNRRHHVSRTCCRKARSPVEVPGDVNRPAPGSRQTFFMMRVNN